MRYAMCMKKMGGTNNGRHFIYRCNYNCHERRNGTRRKCIRSWGGRRRKGGVFKATTGLYDQFGEYRVLDTPLAESAIAGVGIGAAMYGMRPIAEMQFADFIMPAVNQIVSEAAKIRYRSNNDWTCPIVIRAPFGGGVHGALYHSQSVESMFASTAWPENRHAIDSL